MALRGMPAAARSGGGLALALQLSELLGREVGPIRKTDEQPPRISVIDVIALVTGKAARKAANDLSFVKERYPEVAEGIGPHRFPGRRQRDTPVCGARALVELILLLPGKQASKIRKAAAALLVQYLGGDTSLIPEICRARGLQDELAVRSPQHPARVFGEDVEAGGVTNAAGACEQVVGRLLPSLLEKCTETLTEALSEKLTLHIDERFAAFEKLHRARGGPYALPDADPRPLSIAQFLKERAEPVPKNFAPAFGTLVAVSGIPIDPHPCTGGSRGRCLFSPQVFRQQAAKQQGLASESRGRYTEQDRPIMEHCWYLSQPYRQGLVSRAASSESASAEPRPSVLDLLKGGAVMQ